VSTRTSQTVDLRAFDLVLPSVAGLPEDVLKHHLRNLQPVHRAVRKVLESRDLSRLNWSQFEMLLRGISITFPSIVIPEGQLAEDELIRQMFPNGCYMVCPAGVDLVLLHQAVGQFDAKFYSQDDSWFLKSYGEWLEDGTGAKVERIPTDTIEIFIPDPDDWMLPGSKNTTRTRTIEMMEEFGATLPEDWTCPVPSAEEGTLVAFEYHRQTGKYPLPGYNYVRFRNRCGRGLWLRGGGFGSGGWFVDGWDEGSYGHIGGLRWAVRRGKINATA